MFLKFIKASNNNFIDLNFGLIAGCDYPDISFVAKCNNFDYVVNGMYINGIDYFEVYSNTFVIAEEGHPYGIYMENCTGYQLEQNNFSYPSLNWDLNPVGLINYYASQNDNVNEIKHNIFTGFKYSVIIEGEQNKHSDPDFGLVLWCNEFIDYDFAISITAPTGIAGEQKPSGGANNMFPDGGCVSSNEGELFNPSGNNSFTYYHKNNNVENVEPESGCYTSGQVSPSNINTSFVRSTDCLFAFNSCSPVYRGVVHNNSVGNITIQRKSADTLNLPNTTVDELAINEQIRYYLHDSGIMNPFDSIVELINNSGSVGRDYLLACAYKKSGQQSNFSVQLSNLDSNSAYSDAAGLIDMLDSINWSKISSDTLLESSLLDFAADSTKYSSVAARNIMNFVYGKKYSEMIILPDVNSQQRKSLVKQYSSVKVYPNPFTSEISIDLDNSSEKFEIYLYEVLGKELMHNSVPGEQVYKLNTSNLSTGLYLLKVFDKNNQGSSNIINHISD